MKLKAGWSPGRKGRTFTFHFQLRAGCGIQYRHTVVLRPTIGRFHEGTPHTPPAHTRHAFLFAIPINIQVDAHGRRLSAVARFLSLRDELQLIITRQAAHRVSQSCDGHTPMLSRASRSASAPSQLLWSADIRDVRARAVPCLMRVPKQLPL